MAQFDSNLTPLDIPNGILVPPESLEKLALTRKKLNLVKRGLLQDVDLFASFPAELMDKMVRLFDEVLLAKDETLFEEGALENQMYIILTGHVIIFKQKKPIAICGPGEYIGEMSLIESSVRSGSARAKTDVLLLEVKEEHFRQYLLTDTNAVLSLMKTLSRRLREAMQDMAGEMQKLNNFTHDMRNCLVPLGIPEMLLDEVQDLMKGTGAGHQPRAGMEKVGRSYEAMVKVRNNLTTLMDQSLACAKKQKSEYIRAMDNLAPLVKETLEEISCHKVLKEKNLKIKLDGEIMDCPFNQLDIKRVLQNLVINAGHASSPGQTIEVLLQTIEGANQVAVKDDGKGVPPEVKPYLLKETYTSRSDGNGFGLMSCKEIIEEYHHGFIWFDSEEGQGATFHFTLPLKD
ncbi:MAG: ATP-binding protein [Nitrospinaceae bacterium]